MEKDLVFRCKPDINSRRRDKVTCLEGLCRIIFHVRVMNFLLDSINFHQFVIDINAKNIISREIRYSIAIFHRRFIR